MKALILTTAIVFTFLLAKAQSPSFSNPDWASVKGKPRVIRQGSPTEVFFYDLPDRYTITNGESYNEVFNALNRAQQSGGSVGFVANKRSRVIMRVESSLVSETRKSNSGVGGEEDVYMSGSGSAGAANAGKPAVAAPALPAGLPNIAIPSSVSGSGATGGSAGGAPDSGSHQNSGWKD